MGKCILLVVSILKLWSIPSTAHENQVKYVLNNNSIIISKICYNPWHNQVPPYLVPGSDVPLCSLANIVTAIESDSDSMVQWSLRAKYAIVTGEQKGLEERRETWSDNSWNKLVSNRNKEWHKTTAETKSGALERLLYGNGGKYWWTFTNNSNTKKGFIPHIFIITLLFDASSKATGMKL